MAVFEHVVLLLRGIVVHVMPAREASCLKGTALLEYRRWGVRGEGKKHWKTVTTRIKSTMKLHRRLSSGGLGGDGGGEKSTGLDQKKKV
jgi:hypothetical protein